MSTPVIPRPRFQPDIEFPDALEGTTAPQHYLPSDEDQTLRAIEQYEDNRWLSNNPPDPAYLEDVQKYKNPYEQALVLEREQARMEDSFTHGRAAMQGLASGFSNPIAGVQRFFGFDEAADATAKAGVEGWQLEPNQALVNFASEVGGDYAVERITTEMKSRESFSHQLSGGAGQLGSMVLVGGATGGYGVIPQIVGQGYEGLYQRAKGELTEKYAQEEAAKALRDPNYIAKDADKLLADINQEAKDMALRNMPSVIPEIILDRITLKQGGKLLRGLAGTTAGKATSVLAAASSEGASEAITSALQNWMVQRNINPDQLLTEDLLKDFALGFLLGGGMAGGAGFTGGVTDLGLEAIVGDVQSLRRDIYKGLVKEADKGDANAAKMVEDWDNAVSRAASLETSDPIAIASATESVEGPGLSQEAVLKAINKKLKARADNLPAVTVVQRAEDIKDVDIRSQVVEADATVEALVVPGQEIILIASNIRDAKRAEEVFDHESIGHEGVDLVTGKIGKLFYGEVARRYGNTKLGQEIIQKYGSDWEIVGRELVANVAENPDSAPSGLKGAVIKLFHKYKPGVADSDVRGDTQVLKAIALAGEVLTNKRATEALKAEKAPSVNVADEDEARFSIGRTVIRLNTPVRITPRRLSESVTTAVVDSLEAKGRTVGLSQTGNLVVDNAAEMAITSDPYGNLQVDSLRSLKSGGGLKGLRALGDHARENNLAIVGRAESFGKQFQAERGLGALSQERLEALYKKVGAEVVEDPRGWPKVVFNREHLKGPAARFSLGDRTNEAAVGEDLLPPPSSEQIRFSKAEMLKKGVTQDGTGNIYFEGQPPSEWDADQFTRFGKAYGVENFGGLSPIKTITDPETGKPVRLPGGTEGTFSYYEMLWIKANQTPIENIGEQLHGQITSKLARSLMPKKIDDMELVNRLMFGMLSPNAPLLPNEFAQARLKFRNKAELKAFADLLSSYPSKGTEAQQNAWNKKLKAKYGIGSRLDGHIGIGITQKLSNVANMARLFLKNPKFFYKKDGEEWGTYVDRVATQVPGFGTKTASFGGVWQDPANAMISAIDRHMALQFGETVAQDPQLKARFGKALSDKFNSELSKAKKERASYQRRKRKAGDDTKKLMRIEEDWAEKLETLVDPSLKKAKNLDDVMAQAAATDPEKFAKSLGQAALSAMSAKTPKFRIKQKTHSLEYKGKEISSSTVQALEAELYATGDFSSKKAVTEYRKANAKEEAYTEINPSVRPELQLAEWIEEPGKFKVMSEAYAEALKANEAKADELGIPVFPAQWTLWDRIRQRVEPHEVMFPGLHQLPKMGRNQIQESMEVQKTLGYDRAPRPITDSGNVQPSRLVYFSRQRKTKQELAADWKTRAVHMTPAKNLSSIAKEGLQPRGEGVHFLNPHSRRDWEKEHKQKIRHVVSTTGGKGRMPGDVSMDEYFDSLKEKKVVLGMLLVDSEEDFHMKPMFEGRNLARVAREQVPPHWLSLWTENGWLPLSTADQALDLGQGELHYENEGQIDVTRTVYFSKGDPDPMTGESKFGARIKADAQFPEAIRKGLDSTYDIQTHQEVLEKVQPWFDQHSDDYVKMAEKVMDLEDPTLEPEERVLVAMRTLKGLSALADSKRASSAGREKFIKEAESLEDTAIHLATKLSEFGRTMGRAVSMFQEFSELSAFGLQRFARRQITATSGANLKRGGWKGFADEVTGLVEAVRKAGLGRIDNQFFIERLTSMFGGKVPGNLNLWGRYSRSAANRIWSAVQREVNGPNARMKPSLEKFTDALTREIQDQIGITNPKAPRVKRNKWEDLKEALHNPEYYKDVWAGVAKKIHDDLQSANPLLTQDELTAVQDLLGDFRFDPSGKMLQITVKEEMAELQQNINELVREHYSTRDASKATLVKSLMDKLELSSADAGRIAAEISKTYDKTLATEARKQLDAIKDKYTNPKKQKAIKTMERRIVELANLGAFDQADVYNAVAKHVGIKGSYDPAFAAKIKALSEAVQKAPTGFQKNDAISALFTAIQNHAGDGIVAAILAIRIANLVSGPSTQLVNLTGNLTTLLPLTLSQIIRARGNPNMIYSMGINMLRGAVKGGKEGASVLWTGKGRAGYELNKHGFDPYLERKTFKGGIINPYNWLKGVFRSMSAMDLLFRFTQTEFKAAFLAGQEAKQRGLKGKAMREWIDEALGYTESFRLGAEAQASKEGLTGLRFKRRVDEIMESNRSAEIVEGSQHYGLVSTYQNVPEGIVGALASAFAQAAHPHVAPGKQLPPAKKSLSVISQAFVPFIRVVANVQNMVFDFTPVLGHLRAGWHKRFEGHKIKDNAPDKTPDMIYDMHTRAFIAEAMTATLAAMLWGGDEEDEERLFNVTATGPKNPADQKAWRDAGNKPYTVTANGKQIGYKETPLGGLLALLGGIRDAEKYGGEDFKPSVKNYALAAAVSFSRLIFDQAFFKGAKDFMDIAQADNFAGVSLENFIKNQAKGVLIPNFFNQIDRAMDPTKYTESDLDGILSTALPWVRLTGHPSLDVWGRTTRYTSEDMPASLFSRVMEDYKPDPLATFLFSHDIYPAKAKRNQAVRPNDDELSDRERAEDIYLYSEIRGRWMRNELATGLNQGEVDMKNTDEVKAFYNAVSSNAATRAKGMVSDMSRAEVRNQLKRIKSNKPD